MRYFVMCFMLALAANAQAAPLEIAYGKDPLQKMDVSPLKGATNAPILVMVHGGAWLGGDKTDTTVSEPKRSYFAKRGFMFVSVNYRLTPKADAYAQTEDVAAAVKYIVAHAKHWGGDASRMILMGHSAGGHIVSLLGANPHKFGLTPWRGTVSLDSAMYDVKAVMTRKHFPYFEPAFGLDPKKWDRASPIDQLQTNATPFFLVCTPQGPFLCSDAQAFADKAEEKGVYAHVRSEDLEHIELNNVVGQPGEDTNAVEQFMMRVTQ